MSLSFKKNLTLALLAYLFLAKDCTWSEWVVWSPCSVACGSGTKTRLRAKLGPTDGGTDCEGTNVERVACTGALAKCTCSPQKKITEKKLRAKKRTEKD